MTRRRFPIIRQPPFAALRSGPKAPSRPSRQKQIPSSSWNRCLGHSSWPYSLLSLAFCSNRSSNSFELSAALRYHFAASALSSGNPPPVSPASYISPKVCWKNQPPCSAALRNYFTASALSFGTPRPMSYIIPKLTWASSVLRAGRLYRGSEQNKVSGN